MKAVIKIFLGLFAAIHFSFGYSSPDRVYISSAGSEVVSSRARPSAPDEVKEHNEPLLHYTLSIKDLSNHIFHVEITCSGLRNDTIDLVMPRWTPGYYQIMDYGRNVTGFTARGRNGKALTVLKPEWNNWRLITGKGKPFVVEYDVKADRRFVASSWLDSTHGYVVPASMFLYVNGYIDTPVRLKLQKGGLWDKVATGLYPVTGSTDEFFAPDFDFLYDCPILIGDLEEMPSFEIKGVNHRFIAYNPGKFDRELFAENLRKAVSAGIDIIGDIPYENYTFIGIGPGYGGIEHLNNTTVSFDGNRLYERASMNRMLMFLAHEYFHNFNVKRIRPFLLGPFDYTRENRTNLLWVSEGLTVYYEYLIVKRAGLIDEQELLASIESNIEAYENDPGKTYQSLSQASYNTWSDGPFGQQGGTSDRSISYYDKGPVIGMILDFRIRNATGNRMSLDDLMRLLYNKYYKGLMRGFTDDEFQAECEAISGISLSKEFEYVYTTKEIDYTYYLSLAGLKIQAETNQDSDRKKFTVSEMASKEPLQDAILRSWLGE